MSAENLGDFEAHLAWFKVQREDVRRDNGVKLLQELEIKASDSLIRPCKIAPVEIGSAYLVSGSHFLSTSHATNPIWAIKRGMRRLISQKRGRWRWMACMFLGDANIHCLTMDTELHSLLQLCFRYFKFVLHVCNSASMHCTAARRDVLCWWIHFFLITILAVLPCVGNWTLKQVRTLLLFNVQ